MVGVTLLHRQGYFAHRLRVKEFMTRTVITIGPTSPIDDAARRMVMEKIGALPVTDGGRPVGLVTETDVLRLFVRALGAGEPSSRLDVVLRDRPHGLAEVVQTIDAAGVDIVSVATLTTSGDRGPLMPGAIGGKPPEGVGSELTAGGPRSA